MKRLVIYLCISGLAIAALTIAGCGGGGGGGTTAAPTTLSNESYPVAGTLQETDGLAMPGTISVTATDVNGAPVDLFSDKTGGTKVTDLVADADGRVSFYIDSNAALPVTVTAFGSSIIPNHIDNSTRFTVSAAGSSTFVVNIIDMDVPSPGVDPWIVEGTPLDVDDALTQSVNMQTTSTQVTIPALSKFADASGAPLTGKVTASLTEFNSSTANTPVIPKAIFNPAIYNPEGDPDVSTDLPAADFTPSDLENFPGGMNNSELLDTATMTKTAGYFVSAGFVAVNVTDANGNKADSVSAGSYTIRINIPAGTLNDSTGLPVAANDSIPVYSFDEVTQSWIAEATPGTVMSDATGLYVSHTATHFSFWNLGWFNAGACTATLNFANDLVTIPANLKATFANGPKGSLFTGFKPAGESTISLQNVPNTRLDVIITNNLNKVVWAREAVNLCKRPPLTASYRAPLSKKSVRVNTTVTEYCQQDPTVSQVVPTTFTSVDAEVPNTGRVPDPAYVPISAGTTDANGYFRHIVPSTSYMQKKIYPASPGYKISAFDRRTNSMYTEPGYLVVPKTDKPIKHTIKIPVTCNPPTTGSTGGYTF